MILVTGATGTNGREVVKALRALRADVRALVRDAGKGKELAAQGAELAVGDFTRPTTLAFALQGCDRAFLLSAVSQEIPSLERTFAELAKAAGVRHLVKFSADGADPNSPLAFGRLHGQGERAVEATGIGWTHLRPTFFTQNLLWNAKSIQREGRFYGNFGTGRVAYVDVRDIAAVAARVLTDPIEQHQKRVYELRGPQALTQQEIASIFARVLGRTITYVDLTREQAAAAMLKQGMPEWLAKGIAELDALVQNGSAGRTNDTVAMIGRKNPTTVEQLVRENQAAFSSGASASG